MTGPKALIWDIETAPAEGKFWGPRWDPKLVKIEQYPYLLSVAWTWYDLTSDTWGDTYFVRKAKGKRNDRRVVKQVWDLLDEADVAVAHNGDRFDITETMSRVIRQIGHRPSPFISIDTRKEAKKNFRLVSNKLNDIADYLGIGRKVQHTGWDLWDRCIANDEAAWETMEEYNVHDVELLAQVFRKMRPFIRGGKLNVQQWTGPNTCVDCGSARLQRRGEKFYRTQATYKQAYQCQDCFQWMYVASARKDDGRLRRLT